MPPLAITGAGGAVARGVLPHLEGRFALRLLSLDPPGGDPRVVQADVLDLRELTRALAGCEAVLHLAVASGHSGTYEDDDFNDLRFDVNVKGTHHVFEAARRAGVRRVVHVSSLMAIWGHGSTAPVPGDAPVLPAGTYALTKALAEEVARYHARTSGLEVITLRITAPFDPHAPELKSRPLRPQQVAFPDLAEAFALALTVPLAGYQVVTITSSCSRSVWDLGAARRVLGYEPRFDLDALGVPLAEAFDVRS